MWRKRKTPEQQPAAAQVAPVLEPPFDTVTFGGCALQKLLQDCSFESVLDVGSGSGAHSAIFADHGKDVTAVDFGTSVYAAQHRDDVDFKAGDYLTQIFDQPFDLVWACHVLEHQVNANSFIEKLLADTAPGGILAITVPPAKDEIVGGHVSLWNGGLLLYHLVLAGNDCRHAAILRYGYNITILVRRSEINALPELSYDNGDVERLLPFLPEGLSEPFDGNIQELNWESFRD